MSTIRLPPSHLHTESIETRVLRVYWHNKWSRRSWSGIWVGDEHRATEYRERERDRERQLHLVAHYRFEWPYGWTGMEWHCTNKGRQKCPRSMPIISSCCCTSVVTVMATVKPISTCTKPTAHLADGYGHWPSIRAPASSIYCTWRLPNRTANSRNGFIHFAVCDCQVGMLARRWRISQGTRTLVNFT